MVKLTALVLEDVLDDAELVVHELERAGYDVVWQRVDNERDYAAALSPDLDVILADYNLPQFTALRALRLLQERGLDVPFIVITGSIGEEKAVECVREGATDYLLKDRLARLPTAVARALEIRSSRRARLEAEEALRQSEERYRLISEMTSDYCFSYRITADGNHELEWATGAFERITGYTTDELRQLGGILAIVHPDDRPVYELYLADVRQGHDSSCLVRVLRKDGSIRWLQRRARPRRDAHGRLIGAVGAVQDVTEQVTAEQRVRRHVERLTSLRLIGTMIRSSFDLGVTLSTVLEQVISQLQVDAATILLLRPQEGVLELAAQRGLEALPLSHRRIPLSQGAAGQAAAERRTISVPDLRKAQDANVVWGGAGSFVGYLAVPLMAKGEVKGVLELLHHAPLTPDEEWISFLETLAGDAAIAIDSAALFEGLQHANEQLILAYDSTIAGWSRAMDMRDRQTEGHSTRVADLTVRVAAQGLLPESELVHVRRGALLHDIGKIAVPDAILQKPGPLTDEEWAVMKRHPEYAHRLLSPIPFLRPALDIPYCHHEKWDGTGYPRGLAGEEIPLAARIFAVVDVYDALLSERPYRPAWTEDAALAYIREQADKHFDPHVVKVFLAMHGR